MPTGKIAGVVVDKGFGFIQSDEGGEDLFFHHSAINCPLESLAVGQEVAFEVDSQAAKPRAMNLTIQGEKLTPSASPSVRNRNDRADRRSSSNSARAGASSGSGTDGEIASIVADKGFGFIKPTGGGEDLFFHHSAVDVPLESLSVGQQVTFKVDAKSEKPRAMDVVVQGGRRSGSADRPRRQQDDKQRSSRPPRPYKPAADFENPVEGEIASIVTDKGFGFIKPSDGGDDVFFHHATINYTLDHLAVGQQVEFQIDEEAEKPRAAAVRIVGKLLPNLSGIQKSRGRQGGPAPNKPAAKLQDPQPGVITSIVLEKGFGFISSNDGGDDLFFHNSAINYPLETLAVGQTVTYDADLDAEKPRAIAVVVEGELLPKEEDDRGRGNRERKPRGKTERGFVTKLLYKTRQGFISADSGGSELIFDESSVYGEKRYPKLEIGDYVEFIRTGEIVRTKIDKAEKATSIQVVEKEIRLPPKKELPNNPKSRRKKPTWRR